MKHRVSLSQEERALLRKRVSCGVAPAREVLHAQVLLKVDAQGDRLTDRECALEVGVSERTVNRVRTACALHGPWAALSRKPQPARPAQRKLTDEVEVMVKALACTEPPEGRSRWSLHLLAERTVALVPGGISHELVRQALKRGT